MKIVLENEQHNNLYFIDCEYDSENLKQIAVIRLTKIEDRIYDFIGSINLYIKDEEPLSQFFIDFTGINKNFLDQYGVDLDTAKKLINEFIVLDNPLFIGHGIKGDKHILFKNGINLSDYDTYCTVTKAKELISDSESYTAEHLAADEGWFLDSPHDAYHDALSLLPIFSRLKEKEKDNERILS